ncbi:MAG: pentapeptide repeat-containing protein [Myxococcales bacterium]|nr:pentapeptide repeat-containing protein [Myxococcales bacterium]MDP3505759.1 pentapeptide repeat-containing protein [Myxococcales bacterium]
MPKQPTIEDLLKNGSKQWNQLRKDGKVALDHTGATFPQLFSANADLSGLTLIGSEWEKCDLSKVTFKEADLTNSYFHGGRLQDCDFRGANLEGATFEKLKLLRCDFTGARGLEELEFDDCDMDRVVGLNGEMAPPPPPPPAVGITSFTREQRAAAMAAQSQLPEDSDLPPFRPTDPPGTLLFRGLKHVANPPPWVLDVPGLRPPLPVRMAPGISLEHLYREAVKTRLEGRRPVPDMQAIEKAKEVIATGAHDSAIAVMYMREVGVEPTPSDAALATLANDLSRAMEVEDATGDVDPRITGAMLELRGTAEGLEHLGELRVRLAAVQLFTSLLEAGFAPDNNWEEAVDSQEPSQDLAHIASNGNRPMLKEAFEGFAALPDEVRMRRLAYLAEATAHIEAMAAVGEPAPA